MNSTPLASICIVTYNHAPFIAEAIEGALKQKTDFSFEIVIGEDGSTDGTADVCRRYAEKFPHLIRVFNRCRDEVLYVDGYPTARNNFIRTFRACRGRYIAYCEGDDYWQDILKLQKQVDFLRTQTDYGMVHSVADVFYQSKDRFKKYKGGYNPPQGKIYDSLFYRMNIFSSSACCRAELVQLGLDELERFGANWLNGDIVLWLTIAFHSKVHYMDEPFIVYRILDRSASHTENIIRIVKYRSSLLKIYIHFLDKFGGLTSRRWLFYKFLHYCYKDILKVIERDCVRAIHRLLMLRGIGNGE